MARFILLFFALAALLNLWAEYTETEKLILASKPLLMTLLSLWFYLRLRPLPYRYQRLVLLGLIFSVGGDILLMFVENGPAEERFFLYGLASFLLAQLCYMIGFLNYPEARKKGTVVSRPFSIWPFTLLLIGLLGILWPGIGPDLKVPVTIYAFAIIGMAVAAFNLRALLLREHFMGLMAGVMLFVLSDSIIAISKFGARTSDILPSGPTGMEESMPMTRLLIMGTYILGQYFIARNVVMLHKE